LIVCGDFGFVSMLLELQLLSAGMQTGFVPPFPDRLIQVPSPWQRARLWRQNMLAVFEEQAFEYDLAQMKFLTRDIFLFNSPEGVQFAFGAHTDSFERKSPTHRHLLQPLIGDGLFVSHGNVWKQRRRIVASIVHPSRLSEFAPVMVETALEARARWAKLVPAEVDALSEMAQLTAEIICRAVFGRHLGRERAVQIVEGFSDYQRRIGRIDFISLIGLPDWLPRPHLPGVYRSVRRVHAAIDDVIAKLRTQRDGDGTSVISRLFDARDEETGAPLDPKALRNEAIVLLMAGHETTANTLAWTWYILSQTPEAERRLHHEIDEVLGDRPPALADVPKLIFTRAILEEVMRLYPPVPVLSREAAREEKFEGRSIRKGSVIVVSPWLLHRHRKLWNYPDHFIPERFLPGSSEPVSKFAYIPFSVGPRVCAGMAFGLTEAILCVATLAQRFKLRMKPGHQAEATCRITLRPGEKLPMEIVGRV
jgi:cytochrome P450